MVMERRRPGRGLIPWRPFRELEEKEDKFVVKAELPGMKEEDIDVSVKKKEKAGK